MRQLFAPLIQYIVQCYNAKNQVQSLLVMMKNKDQSPRTSKSHRTKQKSSSSPSPREAGVTIVGSGASAGGLKALRSFFESLPDTTGMAFVVITHLHPDHESHLADILQGDTKQIWLQVEGTG